MKKIVFSLFALSLVLFGAEIIDRQHYDRIFNQLNAGRVGLSPEQIASLKNPFPMSLKKSISEDSNSTGYTLYGIFANRAKINDAWYEIGDEFGGYELKEVKNKSVILQNDTQQIELKLNQGKKNVTVSYK
ncbi:MAG: hypothetical protein MR902_03605 [Campylobacter sp.]|nr:hypothetical protein [Campylobacter sp.]